MVCGVDSTRVARFRCLHGNLDRLFYRRISPTRITLGAWRSAAQQSQRKTGACRCAIPVGSRNAILVRMQKLNRILNCGARDSTAPY